MRTTLLATMILAAFATGALAQTGSASSGQTTQPSANQNQTQTQTNQSQGVVKQSQ